MSTTVNGSRTRPVVRLEVGSVRLGQFELHGAEQTLGRLSVVPVEGQPFQQALRAQTRAAARTEWNVQIRAPLAGTIKAGDVLLARFWLRCIESRTGEGFTTFLFELARPGWDKCVEVRASGNSHWQQYELPFRALRDYGPGDAQVCFRLGFDRQTIEIGGLELINYGKSVSVEELPRTRITYAGREDDADWRAAAQQRIEQIRKGDLQVKVQDASGRAIPGARVRARMLRHAFGFGSAVDAEELLGPDPDNRIYRETFQRLFNRAVFENDMKWPQTYYGVPPRVDEAVRWLRERNIAIRGHCLVWPSWRWLPRDLRNYENDPAELRRRAAAHITDLVSHFKGQLIHWDVINEPYNNHDLLDILGTEVMIEWFRLARRADPQCKLFLNDYEILCAGGTNRQHQDHFYNAIRYLIDSGAPIDGIGIQSHFGLDVTPPVHMLEILDRFSEFGLPIESTELSINISDRQLQADFMRDYLTAVFSHPNVHGIMLWGFWEGRHWRPDAALFDSNWQVRPHGKVWIDLVHGQWKTDVTTTTDPGGQALVRGFCGEYEVSASVEGRTAITRTQLPRSGAELTLTLH